MLTRNEDTGELSCWPAVSPYSSPNRALIDVELVDERGNVEVLETTFDHPFYVLGQGWVRVEHLEVGDIVPTSSGQATVVGLAWKGQLATVYNFGVEQTRSYFVGETGAWVHNCFELRIPSGQFGKKWGKHARDYALDPGDPAARKWFKDRIEQVTADATDKRIGPYNPNGGGGTDYRFFKLEDDLVVTKNDGEWVTMFPDDGNQWFEAAKAVE